VCTAMLDMYQNEGNHRRNPQGQLSVAGLDGKPASSRNPTVVWPDFGWQQTMFSPLQTRCWSARWCTSVSKHYFLVDFPQEPGALRRFLDTVPWAQPDGHHAVRIREAQQTARLAKPWSASSWGRPPIWKACWRRMKGVRTFTSRRSSPVHRRIANLL